ncbi:MULTISPECIES: 4Fe-4S dicluster domain-containing protein [Desulfobacula]|uniref:4Fe-4S ferredoxin iron-sulfur binding protein n=2 Tax=Desulfobacula TaxID=28222 RepID=K0NCQ4_DESTT|nr:MULTISPECIES: 4Fe-4S dicluster domain-containing protein [Desulfobacula]CCK82334.1 4Fe-4S ferredoxin iron-sulfur binding protein [Desulfobacula toluolica Tol2]SDU50966.1 Fe-S-cluster-containing dehydrogenase component [Desulfobacula phenolica]
MKPKKISTKQFSRREFFRRAGKKTGGVLAGMALFQGITGSAYAYRSDGQGCELPKVKYELQFDPKKCAGCGYCEVACAQFHEGDAGATHRNRFTAKPLIKSMGISPISANAPGWTQPIAMATFADFSTNEFCRQCDSPECLDACPENAIYVDSKTGARVVDEEKCVGCGDCIEACQFEMMHLNPETEKAYKCDLCDGDPQCVTWCPTKAITFHKL